MNLNMRKFIFLSCLFLIYLVSFHGKRITNRSPERSDIENRMAIYLSIADSLIRSYDLELAKIYLDSAAVYKENVENPIILGTLYSGLGDYYSFKQNDLKAHENYYKGLEYYEKGGNPILQIPIYHNLSFSYIQKYDVESLKRIVWKMLSLALKQEDKAHVINSYRVLAYYYDCLYKKDEKQILFLDSAFYYRNEIISIYEDTKPLNVRPEDIAYDYIELASNLLTKKDYDIDSIMFYINESKKLANPTDTIMIINRYHIEGEIEYQTGNLQNAKQIFESQLSLMDRYLNGASLSMYTELFDRLSKISESLGNFKNALFYEQKKTAFLNQVHDSQKYEAIKDLEIKYEVSRKEQEIAYLESVSTFRKKINYLYVCIIAVSIIAFVFIMRWLLSKKKASDIQVSLLKTEKNEAFLRIQLQEEQLKNTELEKYEALLDSHFKSLQISEKDVELDELKKEQEELNIQIKNYSKKVQNYEKRQQFKPVFKTNDPYFTGILQDVSDLIEKRLNCEFKKEYLGKLCDVSEHFPQRIQDHCSERLSALNLKHCVCFCIEMKTEDIADCFSIETRSVHIIRHRLKVKLNIDKEMDVNTFLKQIAK